MNKGMKKLVTTVFMLLISLSIFSLESDSLKGSIAILTSNVGDMEVSMTKDKKGDWVLKSHLDGGRIVQRKEEEVFRMEGNQIKPLSYSFYQKIFFKKVKSSAIFDWENKNIAYQEGKKESSVAFLEQTLGPSTSQLQLRFDFKKLDLENLPEEMVYDVFSRGEVKTRIYRIAGIENIKTQMGEFSSYKVERVFSKESQRVQEFWLAPELDFAIIRILDINGRETSFEVKSFKILD
jgi:hypothetical protein